MYEEKVEVLRLFFGKIVNICGNPECLSLDGVAKKRVNLVDLENVPHVFLFSNIGYHTSENEPNKVVANRLTTNNCNVWIPC